MTGPLPIGEGALREGGGREGVRGCSPPVRLVRCGTATYGRCQGPVGVNGQGQWAGGVTHRGTEGRVRSSLEAREEKETEICKT